MGMKLNIASVSLVLILLVCVRGGQSTTFDVRKYGAKADGKTDLKQALTSAWKEACASPTATKIMIPAGTFALSEISMQGPCKAPIEIQLSGTLKAPADPKAFQKGDGWVTFGYIDHLTISGGGTFDGQGKTAWSLNNCAKDSKCPKLAMNLLFNFITNAWIHDVTSLNSKNFHVNLLGCKNITFQHFTVTAPEQSINTDGIHIGRSTGVNILNSNIKTGDDCISIGDGSQQVTITGVTCGPGHGFSVGSLGRYPNEQPVRGVFVKDCTLTNTLNGVRIKTWPASTAGTASDMHFESITMNNVGNPVLIDQEYCPWNQCNLKAPSRVKLSNVSFKNIHGTSSTQVAVKLVCSAGVPCENVEIGDINLAYHGKEGPATSHCSHIKPKFTGKQTPSTCVGA